MEEINLSYTVSENLLQLRLFIARLSFLRFDEKCLLESQIQCVEDFLPLSLDDISVIVGRQHKTRLWDPSSILRMTETDIKLMLSYGAKVMFYDSENYPFLLRQIYDPPYALFFRGNGMALNNPCVAMVGTRKPSFDCAKATKTIAKDIAMAGISVVSGLAFGIDSQAHTGALMAQGSELFGKTIAVLGSGVDNITPASNKRIAGAILSSGGCIVSEYQLGSQVQQWQFVERNRIISALSRVVLVMEAPSGSGALHTADFALEHNRELCFYKGAVQAQEQRELAKNVDLFGEVVKKKRCVEEYIQDGAPVIDSANEVLSLVNTTTFIEERAFCKKNLTK